MKYPDTPRSETVEQHFGIQVADPYRWLEGDVRSHPDVAHWVRKQDELARSYLAQLPTRSYFHRRLETLFDHARITAPEKRKNRYFFTRNAGLQSQDVLIVREGLHGEDRILLDPNDWSEDGTAALAEWAVCQNGRYVAFAIQNGGSDWRTIRVWDVEAGKILPDEIVWARYTKLAWALNGTGFFYSRFPEPPEGEAFEAPVTDHSVYFHKIGTAQSADRLVHGTQDGRLIIQTISVTPDQRYAVISSTPGAGGNALSIIDLESPEWNLRTIVADFSHNWAILGNIGTWLFLATDEGAELGKVVTVDLAAPELEFSDIIKEQESRTLMDAVLLGGRLLVTYLADAKSETVRYKLDGTSDGAIGLPGIGLVSSFRGHPDDDEVFFSFTGYNAPTTVYRYDVARRDLSVWAKPGVSTDLDRIIVEQHFYDSKDGTRVPMLVVRRVDVQTPAPTILYGYGGFGISMVPYFSPAILAWVEAGGIYAIANLRGGGEYGKAWHNAGRLKNKQNVFDDFIFAAEYLKQEGISSANGLAIQGESNGGLLIGAVLNQRPDLFAVALAGVGVMDMIRFGRFTNGQFWIGEYGDPSVESDFHNVLSYSPYHTIRVGRCYPAVLVTTADTDDRAVPAHSFKYVAALQAANSGDKPIILRVDAQVGHGAGKPVAMQIDEAADQWAFAAHWTGLVAPIVPDPHTRPNGSSNSFA